MMRRCNLWLVLGFLLILFFTVPSCKEDGPPAEKTQTQLTIYVKNSNAPTPDAEWYEEKSQYDYMYLTQGAWEISRMVVANDSLRVLNPDMLLGSYVSMFSVPEWMSRADTTRHPGRWWRDLTPYLVWTTEGDTASFWVKSWAWNVTIPEARAIAIAELKRYMVEQNLHFIMFDYASVPMPHLIDYQPQWWRDLVHGDPDFDGDGIGHWDDPDEQAKLLVAWYDYVDEVRAAMPDVHIHVNGNLPMKDDEFALKLDGINVENFPWWFFGNTAGPNFINALDPEYPVNLWHLQDLGKYIIIEDRYSRPGLTHMAMCFDKMILCRRWRFQHETDPELPPRFDLGAPLGPATIEDGQLRREFELGVIGIDIINESSIVPYLHYR